MLAHPVNIGDPIFIGDFWGFLLSLAISLFLAYWLSAVKNHWAVVIGAFFGGLLGFLVILAWVGTLIFDTPMADVNGVAVFFGSLLLCSILALSSAILTDLFVAARNSKDYRRQVAHEQE